VSKLNAQCFAGHTLQLSSAAISDCYVSARLFIVSSSNDCHNSMKCILNAWLYEEPNWNLFVWNEELLMTVMKPADIEMGDC